MIEINNLSLTLRKKTILDGINLKLNDGEIIGVIGNSGSGKTIFLRTLSGLTKGYTGNILINDKSLKSISQKKAIRYLSHLGKEMPANRDDTLYNFLLLSRIPYKKFLNPFSDYDYQVTEEYIKSFSLDKFKDEKLNALSDSTLKKALLAQTMIREPETLLLDNPTTELDISSQQLLKKALSKYVIDGSRIILLCSNDLNFVSNIADRIIIMDSGHIAEEGGVEILSAERIKKYFGIEVLISKNIYSGKPEIHFFPES